MGCGVSVHAKPGGKALTERYLVTVYTGTHKESGVGADVTIAVLGANGRCPPQRLSLVVAGDHLKPHAESFEVPSTIDLGKLGAVEFFNTGDGTKADIEIIKVVVSKVLHRGIRIDPETHRWVFPCYGWVAGGGGTRTFFEGAGYLPSDTPPWLRAMRKAEIERAQQAYEWGFYPGQPAGSCARRVADLPRDQRPPEGTLRDPMLRAVGVLNALGCGKLLENHGPWDAAGEEEHIASSLLAKLYSPGLYQSSAVVPDAAKRSLYYTPELRLPTPESALRGRELWAEDAEFARQLLQGPHPVAIRALGIRDLLPEYFNVPELTTLLGKGGPAATPLQSILRMGQTLASEVPNGRVVIADYGLLRETMPDGRRGAYGCAPVVLLYVTETMASVHRDHASREKVLYPVAINLDPSRPESPVWTPNDSPWDWLAAKTYALNADCVAHLLVSRHLQCVAVTEPFALAALRTLAPLHPVAKLLAPHLRWCLASNANARERLLGPHGAFGVLLGMTGEQVGDTLVSAYQVWDFESLAHPVHMASAGFDGHDKVERYPFRDDGTLVYAALDAFVADYLGCYYQAAEDYYNDPELQAWYTEAFRVGLAGMHYSGGRECGPVEACAVITALLWTVSGMHSALAATYQSYGFPVARPCVLHAPPPTVKGVATAETFRAMLPTVAETALQAAYFFSDTIDVAPLGPANPAGVPSLPERRDVWLVDRPAQAAFKRFAAALAQIDEVIMNKNASRGRPYYALMPRNMANGLFG